MSAAFKQHYFVSNLYTCLTQEEEVIVNNEDDEFKTSEIKPHIERTEGIRCRLNALFGIWSGRHFLTNRNREEDNIERNIKGIKYEYTDGFQLVSYKAVIINFFPSEEPIPIKKFADQESLTAGSILISTGETVL
jgi:hypothetical protein